MENENNGSIRVEAGTPSTVTQSFRDQKKIEAFIRQKNLLKFIEDAGETFINKYKSTKLAEDTLSAIVIKLPFVYADFFDKFVEVLHLAVEEPTQFADATKYAIYGLLRELIRQKSEETGLKTIDIDQIHIQLRFIGLPSQRNFLFDPSLNLYKTGLSILDGTLRAHTEPQKAIIQSVWYCATGCARNKIISESLNAPICSSCSRPMSEHTKLRVSQYFFLLRFQLFQTVSTPRIYKKIFRSITVHIKGESQLQLRLKAWRSLPHNRLLRLSCTRTRVYSMESNNTLNETLAALGGISQNDLDEMLEGDISIPSATDEDILLDNAQPLPSQCSDSFGANNAVSRHAQIAGYLDRLEAELRSARVITPSVVLIEEAEKTVATIADDSLNENSVEATPKAIDLTKAASKNIFEVSISNESLPTRNENLETSFDREFVKDKNQNIELLDSFFDDDDGDCFNEHEEPTTSKSTSRTETTLLRFFTQKPPQKAKQQHNERHNISTSCPALLTDEAFGSGSSNNTTSPKTRQAILNPPENLQNSNQSSVTIDSHQNEPLVVQSAEASAQSTMHSSTTRSENASVPMPHVNLLHSTLPYANDASAVPESIKRLFDLMKAHYSDYTFVYALSAQLCQERVPMACYVNVKMALLLSIASCAKNPNVPPIPIILMGNDTYMANLLMTNVANLAARFVGPCDDVKPASSSDRYRNYKWIEADPIQLALGGVYYAGDWACLKPTRSDKIFKDIESSCVAVEGTDRIYPLETAIWAHWRAFKYNAKDQQLFNKFVKVFGIPICMDNRNQDALVDFMLKQASTEIFESTVDHLSIGTDDMRLFLATISERTVDLTAEAANMLRKYFVASRNERPDCLTKQAYPILKQLAESFAKLSLRHEVLVIDAVGAISVCEDFLQHLYGPGVDPPPLLDEGNFVGDIDKHVARFYEWIKVYIEKYCDKDA